jgi:tetratricopeptide (TPR) repeat protein
VDLPGKAGPPLWRAWLRRERGSLLPRCYRAEEEKQMTLGRRGRAVAWLAAWVQLAGCGGAALAEVKPQNRLPGVERLEIVRSLRARQFGKLETVFAAVQRRLEADPLTEIDVFEAFRAFHSADPALGTLIAEWLHQVPSSAAARLARAKFLAWRGRVRRGGKLANETSPEWLHSMELDHEAAQADARRSLVLEPHGLEAYATLIDVAGGRGDQAECRRAAAKALRVWPASFRIRQQLMDCLEPRWGGSYEEMAQVAREAQIHAGQNPALHALAGFVDADRAFSLSLEKRYAEAVELYDRALAAGEYWVFYSQRAEALSRLDKHSRALADLNRALELNPQEPTQLTARGWELGHLGRGEEAAADYGLAMEIDPSNERLRPNLARQAIVDGFAADRAGKALEAIALFTRALELQPDSADARYRRGLAWSHAGDAERALADGREAVRLDPGNLEACRALDGLLAPRQQWNEILAVWKRFLELHPQSADGYLERAGTYHQSGDTRSALADLKHACDLGSSRACALLRQTGGP